MKKTLTLTLFTGSLLFSQSADITGVWKADLQQSKRMGPPLRYYLTIIEQKNEVFNRRTKEEAPLITETTGTWDERGEHRSVVQFFNNGKPAVRAYQGVPTRFTATNSGGVLSVVGEMSGRPMVIKRSYTLSPDGKTLTVNEDVTGGERPMHSTMVLLKQEDAAGEPLRKAEELAGAHFKNVKTALKDVPASQFIDTMRYISWSLNKDCEFCHVEHKFDSDDKKEKQTARKMIDMTMAINEHNFEGKMEVRCFTCHEGREHPLSRPQYSDEIAEEKERAAREAKEREAHRPGPPPPPQR